MEHFKVMIRANQRIESAINSFRRMVKGSGIIEDYKNKARFLSNAERLKIKANKRRKHMKNNKDGE